ncbi:class I tRNA ligase family protein [Patescibacteria group bacterium]|nr:class I tRNA ligase family protein [Patescibacteria group bacterium]MBU1757945.1 class I tRNA ligase family protein [Patescibacteria group bacterium]
MTAGPQSLLEVGKVLLLSLQLYDTLPFEKIFFNKLCCDHKGKKMGTLSQNNIQAHSLTTQYGIDVTRLYLLAHDTQTLCFDKQQPAVFGTLLDSFWNACRYVSLKTKEKTKTK